MTQHLTGLIAATHTPFDTNGELNLDVISQQVEALLRDRITTVFIGGTTGESHSLTLDERLRLTERWMEVVKGTSMQVIVHVGTNCLHDACVLASQAEKLHAKAVAALAPSYFKPANVEALIACCEMITKAAPETPLYYYDIPSMTGVNLSMVEFLQRAPERIPTLAGLKFTNPDLITFQLCLAQAKGRLQILWGVDEMLLPALSCGATGAVGSTYNFAAPIYHRMMDAFHKGDLDMARTHQLRAVELVRILIRRGYMASAKTYMQSRGVNVGPPRLPNLPLSKEDQGLLLQELDRAGLLKPT